VQNNLATWLQKIVSSLPEIKKISEELAIAIIAGLGFNYLHLPVGWLLGPMVVGIVYAVEGGSPQPVPSAFMAIGQAIIAIATAVSFDFETLEMAKTYAIPLLLGIVITGIVSLFNGYLLCRWTGIDRATGFLGCIPGAAHSLVAMSDEMGADAIAVAILQYIRMLLVALIVPTAASFLSSIDTIAQAAATIPTQSNLPMPMFLNLLVLAACGALGTWGGRHLNLPSSGFLGPFFASIVTFWLLPYQLKMPQSVFAGGLLLVGLSIGLKFDWQTVRKLWKAVLIEVALVILLILICMGIGYEFHAIAHVDAITAMLGFSPGGIGVTIASAMQLGANPGLVLAIQMTRLLLILLLSPWLAAFFIERVSSSSIQAKEEEA
jgi:membrane AbrB-like protein